MNKDKSKANHISALEIKSRLIVLNQSALAREWGVHQSTVNKLVNGEIPWSPLMKKLSRRIRVPADTLRSYFVERDGRTASLQLSSASVS